MTVNTVPGIGTITGAATVCIGAATNLTDATAGGVWSSASGNATVGSSSGIVTGVAAGTATISYVVTNSCGSSTGTVVVTINQLPSTAPGSVPICAGGSVIIYANPTGADTYSWSGPGGYNSTAQNPTVSPGSTSTYSLTVSSSTTGCSSGMYTTVVTVNPTPVASPTNSSPVCSGTPVTLTANPGGGANAYSWSGPGGFSSTLQNPVITPTVTGIYSLTVSSSMSLSGCNPTWLVYTTTVTVNTGSGTAGTITGPSSVTAGSNITLTDAVSGGAWSASNSNATVSGGVVTGVTAGTVTISYSVTGTCGTLVATMVVTVNSSISGITGNANLCVGATTTLTNATAGGTWSSSNSAIATANGTSGIVTGIAAGTANITYTLGGSHVAITVTVNASPLPIQGATSECLGVTISLSDGTAGGTWSSSNSNATIDGSGNVTGVTVGTSTTTYIIADGCYTTYPNTVLPNPVAITGITLVCVGGTTMLTDATSGSLSWTSSNTLTATAINSGQVTGVAIGTVVITYKVTSGCIATTIVTVTGTPGAISGNSALCTGSSMTLSDASGAGTWASSNAAIASVGSGSGVVMGIAAGTATITYTPATGGCTATAVVTVNAAAAITGTTTVCAGTTSTLSDVSVGGTWLSGNTGIATIGSSSGIVTGVSTGSVSITYTLVSGCTRTTTVTVTGATSPISGPGSVCAGSVTTMSDATTGGVWSLSSSLIASIGSASGIVTASGTYTGTATISYTVSGCLSTQVLTVNAKPAPIQGATSECAGIIITLTDATAGGTWSGTGDLAIAGTGTAGTLTGGASAGTGTVTYTVASGCYVTYANTTYNNPAPITGTFMVCTGYTTVLSDATAGGAWTSSAPAVASASGYTITGLTAGTAIITYKITTGSCIVTQAVTVNASPVVTAISGPTSISHATPATLSDATAGGVWASSNTSVITLSGSTGSPVTATAVTTSGSSVISYKVTSVAGCMTTVTKTITASPAPPPHTEGVTSAELSKEVTLYPNPTNGAINIRADVAGVFYLYSIDGKGLGEYKVSEGITNITLPNELATGIYMGRYVGDDGSITQFKIVKQ